MSGNPLTRPLVFDGRASPVKSALFFIICAAWILPGLVGHDPWKSDEALVFGVVLDFLRGGNWAIPAIVGQVHTEYPPLYHWLAALSATLTQPWLAAHDGARLASGLCVALTFWYVKKTASRLNDERAGRIAVLLLLGCLGFFLRGHEMNPELAGLAGWAIALFGLTRIRSESGKGGLNLGLGAGIAALSVGWIPALIPFAVGVITLVLLRETGNRTAWRGFGKALLITVPCALAFPALLMANGQALSDWWGAILGMPLSLGRRGADVTYFVTVLPWFALPALPFALWVWVKDRRRIRERFEVAMPLAAFLVSLLVLSFLRKGNDAVALCLLPPLVLASAGAPDRLPRGLARFVDWFGLVFFGLLVLALWLYWTAAVTGVPAAAARAVARQAPGFDFAFSPVPFILAVALTVVWVYAVVRAHRNNRRAIVNWSAGITIVWVLVNLLALAAFDHVRSYRGVSAELRARLPAGTTCLGAREVGDAQRALLYYFGSVRLQAASADCPYLLTQGTRDRAPAVEPGWTLLWEGARPGDNLERLRLYGRPSGMPAR